LREAVNVKFINVLMLGLLLAACGSQTKTGTEAELVKGEEFAAVPQALITDRGGRANSSALVGEETFLLAIKKSAMTKRWFLSAFLSQIHPANASNIPFSSLSTKVVSFKEQNGKLYVFDVDNSKKWSDQLDPQVVIDAYPIINSTVFGSFAGANDYLLIDPSAGLNKYSAYSDVAAGDSVQFPSATFTVNLNYSKGFRRYDDGIAFDQVFTGYSNIPDFSSTISGPENPYRASGTLTMSLREYKEGAGFIPTEPIGNNEGSIYFESKPALIPNTNSSQVYANKWNFKPGMKPRKWVISKNILEIAKSPELKDYDVVGAIKLGIEQWNDAYGFKVFEAAVAGPNDTIGDEDKSFLLVDDNPSAGFAFANWRDNPNTGEIRAASIYFSSVWFGAAISVGDSFGTPAAMAKIPSKTELAAMTESEMQNVVDSKQAALKQRHNGLTWDALDRQNSCSLKADEVVKAIKLQRLVKQMRGQASTTMLTKKQAVEQFLTHVVTHEVGHTLGLRHNFKGSLKGNVSSSVMDYLTDSDSLDSSKPGSHDIAAVRYAAGLTTTLPSDQFCNDGFVSRDADCTPFDTGTNPWIQSAKPNYLAIVNDIDIFGFIFGLDSDTHNYVRGAQTPAVRADAYNTLMTPAAPIDPALLAKDSFYGLWFNLLGDYALNVSYLASPAQVAGAGIRIASPVSGTFNTIAIRNCTNIANNSDKIRTYRARNTCVNVLDKLHSDAALVALKSVKENIAKPENQPASTATASEKANYEVFRLKIDRVLSNWL
jgi:Met-zincin